MSEKKRKPRKKRAEGPDDVRKRTEPIETAVGSFIEAGGFERRANWRRRRPSVRSEEGASSEAATTRFGRGSALSSGRRCGNRGRDETRSRYAGSPASRRSGGGAGTGQHIRPLEEEDCRVYDAIPLSIYRRLAGCENPSTESTVISSEEISSPPVVSGRRLPAGPPTISATPRFRARRSASVANCLADGRRRHPFSDR